MEIIAYQKFIRTSPRKLRLVADAVRNLHPTQALIKLKFINKRAAEPLAKVFKQAVSNAVNNSNLKEVDLKIKHLQIEEGPTLKRWHGSNSARICLVDSLLRDATHRWDSPLESPVRVR